MPHERGGEGCLVVRSPFGLLQRSDLRGTQRGFRLGFSLLPGIQCLAHFLFTHPRQPFQIEVTLLSTPPPEREARKVER